VIRSDGTERCNAVRFFFTCAVQEILEFAYLVAAIKHAGHIVALDRNLVLAAVSVHSPFNHRRWQISQMRFWQLLRQSWKCCRQVVSHAVNII